MAPSLSPRGAQLTFHEITVDPAREQTSHEGLKVVIILQAGAFVIQNKRAEDGTIARLCSLMGIVSCLIPRTHVFLTTEPKPRRRRGRGVARTGGRGPTFITATLTSSANAAILFDSFL